MDGPGPARRRRLRALGRARLRRGRTDRAGAGDERGQKARRDRRPVSSAVAWLREAPARRIRTRHIGAIALLAAAYYGSAKLGFEFAFSGPVAAIIWLPAGVGIAFLYVGGLALWPGVLIGDL